MESSVSACNGVTVQHYENSEESENLDLQLLKDFDSCFEDIEDRLSVSRMVSDSVIRGMVCAVEQEAKEKIAQKDLELKNLKERLPLYHVGFDGNDSMGFSMTLFSKWQEEIEFQSEIERMVISNCIKGLQEEFEQRLRDHNSQSYSNESSKWIEITNQISSLRQELGAISKFFSVPDGQLLSHGSLEHRNGSGDHFSSVPIREENGNHDESIAISVPENFDHEQLQHLSKEQLVNYFKIEMGKMKRDYESQLIKVTEKYFSLKRDHLYLKEPGCSLSVRKELDSFRKMIPEAILRLDNIHVEIQSLDNLKDRLESLVVENRQLGDLVTDKKKEIQSLLSQASDASEQISKHTLAEEILSRRLKHIESTMEDAQIEASISQDVYKFLLRKVLGQMEGVNEELNMECDTMQAIYANMLKEASENAVTVNNVETGDSVIESIIMQGMCEIVLRESLKEAKEKVEIWNQKYIDETQVCISLEMKLLEKENSLEFNVAERVKLEEEKVSLRATVDEKAKLLQEAEEALVTEKEKFELTSQELNRLTVQSTYQVTLITEYKEELHVAKSDLAKALEKVEMDRRQISELAEQLEIVKQNLSEADEEKKMLHSILQKNQHDYEAREREHMKQLNSNAFLVQELSKAMAAFECRTTEDIKMNYLRLGNLRTQSRFLIQKANRLKKMGLQYKQQLDKKSCDLQKAEAEVDLLGDEVDALLSLLEKIYIALDHYSPILQHYPGVMEILKLVRRELSGESIKSV
ncbi:WPP domain-associated protein [Euphorbia peplus]|nr:WPP domain-associated protein [Euphorbia peplus]